MVFIFPQKSHPQTAQLHIINLHVHNGTGVCINFYQYNKKEKKIAMGILQCFRSHFSFVYILRNLDYYLFNSSMYHSFIVSLSESEQLSLSDSNSCIRYQCIITFLCSVFNFCSNFAVSVSVSLYIVDAYYFDMI